MNHSMILPYQSLQQGGEKIMIFFGGKLNKLDFFPIKPDFFD